MIKTHYGIPVRTDTPITGVAQNNHVQWLYDELDSGIDVTCEECEHNDSDEDTCCGCSMADHTILIGSWHLNSEGQYEPDKGGEYAAICGEIYTQVVWSLHTKRCALCSPCYPGQGDLDTPGEFLCYDLPPDVVGDIA